MSEPTSDKPDRLLHSVPHAAQLLDIGVSTVWKLIADGELPTVRIGRSRRIPHESLVKLAGDSTSKVLAIGNED
jgi:excisionase family DNA binding protein